MSNNNINSVLHRKLSPGLSYNKLIEKTGCKVTRLGDGNTYFSIDKIKEYSLKFQYQTEAIATRLVKRSLEETVNSFFTFCYDHFQYKADGQEQNIKSPACAWHSRKEGMDCKSFSVLASTLCSNAGIKHYIRKIKQPFFHNDQFTHVYVIVPIDQKSATLKNGYYIIDGTTHDNKEAVFIDKNDTYMDKMPHFGLNAPSKTRIHPIGSSVAQKAVNSCGRLKPGFTFNKGGRSITQHGLNGGFGLNGSDISRPMSAFYNLMAILNENGVSKCITMEIMKRLEQYTSQNIDPLVAISCEGIVVEGELFRFIQPGQNIKIPSFIIEYQTPKGMGSTGFDDIINSAIKEITDSSDGWLQGIFSKIVGFFNCWGSSATPKKAEEWAKNKIAPWATKTLAELTQIPGAADAFLTTQLNKFSKDLSTIKAHQLFHKSESNSKCGRDANQAMADYINEIEKVMIGIYTQMKGEYTISGFNRSFIASQNNLPGLADVWKGKTVNAVYFERDFKLKPGANGGLPPVNFPGTIKPPTTGGTPTTTPTPTPTPTTNPTLVQVGGSQQPQKAGMNWLLVALLAGGAIYGINQSKSTAKK